MIHPRQTIYGQPPSKSNLQRTTRGGIVYKPRVVKDYEDSFTLQCALRGKGIKWFKLSADVYFKSNQPDLDNSLKVIMDCLQKCGAIQNDRYCMEIHVRKLVDKQTPRIEFEIEEFE